MFQVDLDTLVIDCDPHPVCARLPSDKPLNSSLNPIVEQVLLDSDDIRALCDAENDQLDRGGADSLFDDCDSSDEDEGQEHDDEDD
jgi:hypothetical protein